MTSAAPPLVRLEKIAMRFGRQEVLRDLSLDIARGQSLVVIGESGCGKTVLLKLIIGLMRPTAGRALFDGRVLVELSEKELVKQRLRFGFLFQGSALFDSMTVFDNVAFPLRTHTGAGLEQMHAQVRQRLLEVGLTNAVAPKKPAELSGGMKKRVALARAIILNPEIMLYDEPTTGLDPIMTDVINELIVQTHREHGVTTVVVTHEMRTVAKVADRIVMLYPLTRLQPGESQIVFDGSPGELDACKDPRVRQFVEGSAGDRLRELRGEVA